MRAAKPTKGEYHKMPMEEFDISPCLSCQFCLVSTRGGISGNVGYYCDLGYSHCERVLVFKERVITEREEALEKKEKEVEKNLEGIRKKGFELKLKEKETKRILENLEKRESRIKNLMKKLHDLDNLDKKEGELHEWESQLAEKDTFLNDKESTLNNYNKLIRIREKQRMEEEKNLARLKMELDAREKELVRRELKLKGPIWDSLNGGGSGDDNGGPMEGGSAIAVDPGEESNISRTSHMPQQGKKSVGEAADEE